MLRRAISSLALRGIRGTLARIRQEFVRRPAADPALHLLARDGNSRGIRFDLQQAPRVSIIIPVHGKLDYTIACLQSIMLQPAIATFEVIVVDDASPDDTASVLASVHGVHLLSHAENRGFIGSCNAGAAAALGEFLLFLNNDTQVTSGWLDALLGCFAENDDCGIAGSRLVYPDGRLQEAGGLVFSDASGWNVGRFEARDNPAYAWRREVDYVSGAAMMIPHALFDDIGGFDPRYAPAYYEDTDLAFAVRQAGKKVYYEPASTVIHLEGISSGTDLYAGMKRYQLINQQTFAAKWAEQLATFPEAGCAVDRAIHRRARGRILVVDSTTPDPTRDSGSLRLVAILRLLAEQNWDVCFLPDDGRASAEEVAALGSLGTEVLCRPWVRDLPRWLRAYGSELYAVMLCRHNVAGQYVAQVRKHAPQAKLLFDTVDLHFLREQRAATLDGNSSMARQASASQRSELALIAAADLTFVVSPHEQSLLARLVPQARVALLSNVHEVREFVPPYAHRHDLVFIGGHGHPPNVDALHWIADEILPVLREALPDIVIHVLGDLPESARRELSMPGLALHGRVPELAPWLDNCLASIAPLRFGAGVKGKINMAMSFGLPVIATPIAVEGMRLVDGIDVILASTAADFTSAVMRLMQQERLWSMLSSHGLLNVQQHFSPAVAAATLRSALDS